MWNYTGASVCRTKQIVKASISIFTSIIGVFAGNPPDNSAADAIDQENDEFT